ncbi:MAG TPA: chemotaxis protein CheC [Bacillota bacterium]
MQKLTEMSREKYRKARQVVADGIRRAGRALSDLVGKEITTGSPAIKLVPLRDVPGLAGGPEAVVAAAYLAVSGDITAHIVLCFDLPSAHKLAGLLLDSEAGDLASTEFSKMARSALGETGNVTCSSLLNALSDHTGLTIRPSIPVLVVDMAGAILSAILAELGPAGDEAMLIETVFGQAEDSVNGYLFLLPNPESLKTIIRHLGAVPSCPSAS